MSTIKSSAENLTLNADGANNDIILQSNGSTKATLVGEGNIGIGVTPESWDSDYKALQIGNWSALWGKDTSKNTFITNNVYRDSGGYKYLGTDIATNYSQASDGAHKFYVAASGSADAAITWTTGFEVLNDGKARAKNGLLFGTDTAAANALDDYEEGTYTVAITMGSGTAAVDGSNNTLAYTKVGRLVTIGGQFRVGSVSSPDGSFGINLPFTSANGGEMYCSGTYRTYNIDTPNDGVAPVIHSNINQATATLEWSRDGSTPTEERATASGYFMIGLTYMTA